jgi:benzoate-CoA ligase
MAMHSEVDHSVSPPRITIPRDYNAVVDLIGRNLRTGRAAKVAYHNDHSSYTYAELAERVDRVASTLVALGLQMEQRVLLCLHDTIDFPACFLGSIKAGVVPIAANTLLTTADYGYMLHDSRALALVVSGPLLPTFATLLGTSPFLKHVIVSGADARGHLSLSALLAQAEARFEPAKTTCDDACFWLYSSGSMGTPKGTVHAHSSLIQTAELYARPILGIRENDVVFSTAIDCQYRAGQT